MKTVDVLVKAREYIANGWRQGAYCNKDKTCFCALGAIGYASPGVYPRSDQYVYESKPERTLAARYLGESLPSAFKRTNDDGTVSYYIAKWNDAPGRTVGEVLAAFDRAIKNAKRRHINGGARKTAQVNA